MAGNLYSTFLYIYPFSGLFIVFLWAFSICSLIQGHIAAKNANFLIGLAILCFINMFYIPTVLQYKLFEYVGVNMPLYIGNIIAAIIISIRNKWKIELAKVGLLYLICCNLAYIVAKGNGDAPLAGVFYIIIAVVIVPIYYYFYAKHRFSQNP